MHYQHNGQRSLALAVALIAGGTVPAAAVNAQTTDRPRVSVLEEIVVTARKREESLQDIGQSVSAFGIAEIENRFANNISDIVDVSPNLIIDDTAQGPGGVAAVTIRGIGVAEVESSFDPAVGVVIDGLFLGKASGSITQLIDVERVEVLRGPQGTLFGRNAIGGVINVTRTKPTHDLTGKVRASYGNYDNAEIDGYTSFGLAENLAVKLNYSRHEQGEGYYDNLVSGDKDGEVGYEMYGAHFLWTPTMDLDLEYSFTREEYEQDAPPLLNLGGPGQLSCDVYGYCAPAVGTPISGDRYDVLVNGPNDASFDADTHIASASWALNDAYTLDYIFGHRETDEKVFQDWDGTPETLYHTSRPEVYEQTSHELRLGYQAEKFNYVVGAYFFESDYTIDLESYIGFAVPNTIVTVPQTASQKTESYAVFFEADYSITPEWVLTLGGRYGSDEKQTQITNDPVISHPSPVEEDWAEFTPKLGLKWFARDDLMLYGLFSSGYRSGGFSGRPSTQEAADLPYDPETVDNFEVGFKSQWFDNRLRLNGSIFQMNYDDKQEEQSVSTTVGTGQQTIVANASTATITGAEFDFVYLPKLDGLEISGNIGLLNAEYEDFVADIGRGGVTDNDDLELRRAPEVTASLAVKYEWAVANGTAWTRVGWHFIDEHEVSLLNSPQSHNDEQHLVDASINYDINSVQVSLFGRNLTDEDGYTVGFDVGGLASGALWTYAAPRDPRTYGVQVSYDF